MFLFCRTMWFIAVSLMLTSGPPLATEIEEVTHGPPPKRRRSATPRHRLTTLTDKPSTSQIIPETEIETRHQEQCCSVCDRKFSSSSNLVRHTRTVHNNSRQFLCKLCSQSFARKDDLTRHSRRHPSHQCTYCFGLFPSWPTLRAHQARYHIGRPLKRRNTDFAANNQKGTGSQQRPPTATDPIMLPSSLRDEMGAMGEIYENNWRLIRNNISSNRLQTRYNFRMPIDSIKSIMEMIFERQATAYKLNASPGYVLRNRLTSELRYYYACCRNSGVYEKPFLISNRESMIEATEALEDFIEHTVEYAYKTKPNSQWVVETITNVTLFVNKLVDYPIGSSTVILPHYITNNRGIYPLTHNYNGPISDRKCVFRCIAVHNGAQPKRCETETNALFATYVGGGEQPSNQFKGVRMDQLQKLENMFSVAIDVYQLKESSDCQTGEAKVFAKLLRRSIAAKSSEAPVLRLNLHDDHFSLIHDFSKYARSFACSRCDKLWPSQWQCDRHAKTCTGEVQLRYQGGPFRLPPTIFDLLEEEGFPTTKEERIYPYRCTFDYETFMTNETANDGDNITATQITAHHVPMSVSVYSNVPGYENTKCFISNGNSDELVALMIDYMNELADKAGRIMTERFRSILESLVSPMEENQDCDSRNALEKHKRNLHRRLTDHLTELPCIGFNSGRYDLNVIKQHLFPLLVERKELKLVIKRSNDYLFVKTDKLKFIDMINFLAPGYSYEKFLKAFKCIGSKGRFPFEYINSLEKLNETRLPPIEAFYSTLTRTSISGSEYDSLRDAWVDNDMRTIRDLLVWYNNGDVVPFMEALDKYAALYATDGIDSFKDAITVPGLAFRELFQGVSDTFYLFDERHKQLYHTMRDNMVGGPSIIFTRYHERGVSRIRHSELGRESKLCGGVCGFDANSLYMGCTTMFDMPCGMFVHRSKDNRFRPTYPRKYGRMACDWLEWVAQCEGIKIRHQMNSTEKCLTDQRIRVDGYCSETQTAYQFAGCYWHGHSCNLTCNMTIDEAEEARRALKQAETQSRIQALRESGYRVVEMKECEWTQMISEAPKVRDFCSSRKTPMERQYGHRPLAEETIIASVENGDLFGVAEVDIEVPEGWIGQFKNNMPPKEYYSDLPPIFKNAEVNFRDIGEHMQRFTTDNQLSEKPRRMLVSSYFAKQAMIATPLLQWYLRHGIVITRVYQVIEYTRARPFSLKGHKICDIRRAADRDPDLAVLGDTAKTRGNSYYGKSLTDQMRQMKVQYCGEKKASKLLNDSWFRSMNEVADGVYEVNSAKKLVKLNLPIQIGFFVYAYAKLRMLEFVYDFLVKYVDRNDFELAQMDTDSMYIALSGSKLEDVIRPELRLSFWNEYDQWFPAPYCADHKAEATRTLSAGSEWLARPCCQDAMLHAKRTPGLFKLEWSGSGIIALSSKTYYCFGQDEHADKYSCKGVSRKTNDIDKKIYLDVIRSGKAHSVLNAGFRSVNNEVVTYVQAKAGFSYSYWKRIVQADGVSTCPLLI